MTTEDRQVRAVRPARAEPSWGRVLLTTAELWVSRRLGRAGYPRRRPAGPRSDSRARLRPSRWGIIRRRRLQKLVLAVAAAAAVALGALQFTGAFSGTAASAARPSVSGQRAPRAVAPRPVSAAQAEAAAVQDEAATWIAGQVDSAAVIGCYPAMCASLEAQGVSAARLVSLGPGMAGILRTDVIATLPSADKGLVAEYAPALIASFGSGSSRIEIRAVAVGGAAAYQSAVRADLAARKSAGAQLLKNPRIKFSAADAAELRAGEVDSRLLATLAALSSQFKLRVMAFGDSSPGAPLLFRGTTVVSDSRGNDAASLAAVLAMVKAQESPYLPAHASIVQLGAGQAGLLIEFALPSPLGLLTGVVAPETQPGSAGHG